MNKKSILYNFINIMVLLLTAALFITNYIKTPVFFRLDVTGIVIITATVILVHFLKAFRLYLALYGSNISVSNYAKVYCKVTPVSIVLPFKLGELFRIYCYGHQINNMLKGVVTVILDRFMDTVALVTMILFVWLSAGGNMVPLVYILVVFLVAIVLMYFAFPGLYSYWKKYILRSRATPGKLKALRFLDNTYKVYEEIVSVSKGRGVILYILSLVAWAVEIGSVALISRMLGGGQVNEKISSYLTSALSNNQSVELRQFIFISIGLLIVIYLIVKLIDTLKFERN